MTKKKKDKNTKKIESNFNQEIIAGLFLLASVITLLSLFNLQMGFVGKVIRNSLQKLAGFGSFFIPIALFGISLILVMNRFKGKETRYIILVVFILLILLILLDSGNIDINNFKDRIQVANELSKDSRGGGLLGSFLGYFFYKLFGAVGGILILLVSALISIIYVFKINMKDQFKIISKKYKSYRKNKRLNVDKNNKKEKETNNFKYKLISKKKEVIKSEPTIKQYNESFEGIIPSNPFNEEELKLENKNLDELDSKNEINLAKSEKDENYNFPSIDLLTNPSALNMEDDMSEIKENARKIEETMENFGIDSEITHINRGPTITCYELEPAPGVKLNKIVSLSDNIAMALASQDIRIEAPIPGKSAVGIEVPNKNKQAVLFKEMILTDEFKNIDSNIPLTLGKDVTGNPIISTIDKMPHLLIAGATGSGKSVCINTIIMSILYKSTPDETKLLLIDPKVVELGIYNDIPHLLIPVVTDPKKATFALNWAVSEMESRYKLFAENGVRNIQGYNKLSNIEEEMPNIVIVIDELADLMMVAAKEIESYICRLAQMARAAGMYLILATQRPSVDVITGTIKANIPSRISFAVTSQIDSRTILDASGAEKLLGKGDMLFYPSNYSKPKRIQGAFISDEEVESVVNSLKEEHENGYNEQVVDRIDKASDKDILDLDPMLEEAIRLIVESNQASISMIQRELNMGYNRARKIIDDLEVMGVVGAHEGSKARKVLITEDQIQNFI